MKAFLASAPVIEKSNAKEPITFYLAVLEDAITAVLVQEVEKEERPVSYQMIEKVALDLVITARRMCMYFHNHRILVRTEYPIMKILAKPDFVGRMIGWDVELSEFQIQYQPRGQLNHNFSLFYN